MSTQAQAERKGFMEMCPMMGAFRGSGLRGGKRALAFLPVIPGFLLVLGGVLILTEPLVLVWLAAGGAILFGTLISLSPIFVRKMIARRR